MLTARPTDFLDANGMDAHFMILQLDVSVEDAMTVLPIFVVLQVDLVVHSLSMNVVFLA